MEDRIFVKIRRTLAILLVVCFLLSVTAATVCAQAANKDANKKDEDNSVLKSTKKMKAADVLKEIKDKKKSDKQTMGADKYLKDKGLKEGETDNDVLGIENKLETKDSNGNPVEITETLYVQNYKSSENKNKRAALVRIKINDNNGNEETYVGTLELEGEDIKLTKEHAVDKDGNVKETHSWFSCVWSKMGCCSYAPSCLPTISTGWAAFLGCLAPCGWCLAKALSCCTCNCSWWCKYAVGCCSR